MLALIPDYGIVISILITGNATSSAAVQSTFSQLVQVLLLAIEQAGKDEAQPVLAGTFTDAATNSSIILSVDDSPGLAVSNWTVRGANVPANYIGYAALGSGGSG